VATFIIRRLMFLPLVAFVVTLVVFAVIWSMGPDVLLRAYMTGNASKSPNAEQRIIEKYGLDMPAVVMYFKWFGNTLRGDMGYSLTASSRVSEAILARLPASLELLILALIPIMFFGSRLGIRAAMHPDGFTDSVFGFLSIVGWATPDYVMALLILVGSFTIFGWLPIGNLTTSLIKDWNTYSNSLIIDSILNLRLDILLAQLVNLIQPVLTLFIVHSAYVFQISRATALEVKKKDFIRAARSRGVSERTIMLTHVRRNALIPVVTVGGELFASLFAGLAFVETIFARPGIGRLLTEAAISFEVLTLSGLVLLIAAVMLLVNIVVDIIYSYLDPRILLWDNGKSERAEQ